MSRATELAAKIGADQIAHPTLQPQLEAFYHATRAEMANEIIAEWEAPYKDGQLPFIDRLRAMADREEE